MTHYGQYCPVARAAEILADRWTVLIVRELLADVNHFNELERGLPHMSRSLLAERLRRLQQAGVLERRGASRGKPTEYRRVWLGRVNLSEALRRQQVRLDGTPADVRAFSGWFAWSPMADVVRAAVANQRMAPNRRNQAKLAKSGAR
jgi:DNA-binding HxlR family transcriptional regulator